jgi:Leucine-rich repeat (LRR) protein
MTRDLCYMINLSNSLRKLDLSHNRIYYIPDLPIFEQMVKLEFLLLEYNEIMGWQ